MLCKIIFILLHILVLWSPGVASSSGSRWILLAFTNSSERIIAAKDFHDSDRVQTVDVLENVAAHTSSGFVTVSYQTSEDHSKFHVLKTFMDPRHTRLEWLSQSGDYDGATEFGLDGHVAVALPITATNVAVTRREEDIVVTARHRGARVLSASGTYTTLLPLPHTNFAVPELTRRRGAPHATLRRTPREAHAQALDCGDWAAYGYCPEYTTHQYVTKPDRTVNVVFLPAGFRETERDAFNAKVKACIAGMQVTSTYDKDASQYRDFQPWPRYYSTLNVFDVWFPSSDPQSGVSEPVNGISRDDPLGCSYGSTAANARGVACNQGLVLSLASYSPRGANTPSGARTPTPGASLVVVLVNSASYGGTGGGGIATVYSGEKMVDVFIHEMGHAFAGLADEYSYGISTSSQVPWPNCHHSSTGTPWDEWKSATGAGPTGTGLTGVFPNGDVIPSPVSGCSYDNYVRPSDSCLMLSNKNKAFCPACRQSVAKSIFTMLTDLSAPRFPIETYQVVITQSESARLSLNLVASGGYLDSDDMTVTWTTPRYTGPGNHSSIIVYGNVLGLGNSTVTAVIQDSNPQITAATRATIPSMTYTATFAVNVVADNVAKAASGCTPRSYAYGVNTISLCLRCIDGSASCDWPIQVTPYNKQASLSAVLDDSFVITMVIGGFLILLGFVIMFLLYCILRLKLERRARSTLPYDGILRAIQLIVMGGCIIMSALGIVTIIGVAMQWTSLSIFFSPIATGAVAVSGLVYLVGLLGFSGAYYKSKEILLFTGTFVLLMFIGFVVVTIIVFVTWHATSALDDAVRTGPANATADYNQKLDLIATAEGILEALREKWDETVLETPSQACAFEGTYECSGFDTSCQKLIGVNFTTSYCPIECDTNNANPEPCLPKTTEMLLDIFPVFAAVCVTLTVVLFLCCVALYTLCGKLQAKQLKAMKLKGIANLSKEETANRAAVLLSRVTPEEKKFMHGEFDRLDVNGDRSLSANELKDFLNDLFEVKLKHKEITDLINTIDADQNGVLNFDEFLRLFEANKEALVPKNLRDPAAFENLTPEEVKSRASGLLAQLTPSEKKNMEQEFKELDSSGDGKLSAGELGVYLRRVGEGKWTSQDIERILMAVDADSDGSVDFHEFLRLFQTNT